MRPSFGLTRSSILSICARRRPSRWRQTRTPICLGAYILYNTFLRPLLWDLYRTYGLVWLGNIMDGIPTLVIAVLIILLGLYLVKGPSRHEDASGDDYTAFKGDGSNG